MSDSVPAEATQTQLDSADEVLAAMKALLEKQAAENPDQLTMFELDPEEVKRKLPDAATIRAVVVAVVIFIGAVIGKSFDQSWIDPFIGAYVVVAPLALGWWIKRRTPGANKVLYVGKHRK